MQMHLTDDDVIKILKLIEESQFSSLELEYGDLKLKVFKNGNFPGQLASEQQQSPQKEATAAVVAGGAPGPASEQKTDFDSHEGKPDEGEGLIAIKAPMVGTFYCSPEPGAEPFVDLDSGRNVQVEKDTIVGLIETMKVFSSVAAGIRGEIVRQLVKNSQFVEYNQPLFLVRPGEEEDQ